MCIRDSIISPSEYTKGVLREYGVRRDIQVISNGVDTDAFRHNEKKRREFRREHNLQGLVVYSVGHVFKRKGVIEFIELARKFPDNQFMWVGRNYRELGDSDVKKAVKKKPENVIFTGYVKDVAAAYSAGDIFLFPSWCENQGISVLEAAASGRPIIIRDLPTYEGWLTHGVNCLKAKDNQEFEKHIISLIDDEDLRGKLAENAYRMSQEHALKKVGAQMKEAYETLLRK